MKYNYENFYSTPEKLSKKEIAIGIGGSIMAVFSFWVFVVVVAALTN